MTGALDGFDMIPGIPLTFDDFMNVLRDIVTSINSMIRSTPNGTSQKIVRGERKSIVGGDKNGRRNLAAKVHTQAAKSLEKRLHQVVQYLLYFRNTDGSFGEPMVEQSVG